MMIDSSIHCHGKDVIAGQGTIALEVLQQIDDLDAIIAPVGGGGLVSIHLSSYSNTFIVPK